MWFKEKGGGNQTIAVGRTIRRFAIKVGTKPVMPTLIKKLRPAQLGVSTGEGCNAPSMLASDMSGIAAIGGSF